MSETRDFIYCRRDIVQTDPAVSQDPASSDLSLAQARIRKARQEGFNVHRQDVIIEGVSERVTALGRPKFMKLLRRLRPQDGLIVLRFDELGRDAADILSTVRKVKERRAELYCLAVSDEELRYAKDVMTTLKALAKLDQNTVKTKRVGHPGVGRPSSLNEDARIKVQAGLAAGEKITDLARRFDTSRQTIMRIRDTTK